MRAQEVKIDLININGEICLSDEKYYTPGSVMNVDVSSMKEGLYLVRMDSGEQVLFGKVVIR